MSEQPMTDGPLVHKLRAEDATSVTLVSVPPFGGAVFPEVWHVPTRVYNAILAARNDAEWTAAYEKWDHVPAAGVTLAPTPPDALRDALERADQWVLSHRGKEHDWACPKCHPSDYIGRGDFTCAIHEAECRAALAQPKEADRE